jgi:uncharacterized protein YutE (UPF0331/DUF86 family)
VLSADQQFQAASQRLREAVARARALQGRASLKEALAFNLERAAWAMIDLAQAWVFEQRLGIPRKETESFDLLVAHGAIELDRGRRYKQLCEFRSLSARENERIDWSYLQGDLTSELDLLTEWDERVAQRTRA